MKDQDDFAGASAPSDLDEFVNEADLAPLPEQGAPAAAATPEPQEEQTPSEALKATVEAGQQERERNGDQQVPEWRKQEIRQAREQERLQRAAEQRELAELRERVRKEQEAAKPQPDMFSDPEGYTAAIREAAREEANRVREEARQERLADRKDAAEDKFGADTVRAAYQALADTGDEYLAQRFMAQRNPYVAMVNWHKEQTTLKEIGTDPAAYREKQRQEALKDPEFLAKAYEAFQAQAAGNQQWSSPQSARRTPLPSLGRAGSAASPTAGSAGITTAEEAFGGR